METGGNRAQRPPSRPRSERAIGITVAIALVVSLLVYVYEVPQGHPGMPVAAPGGHPLPQVILATGTQLTIAHPYACFAAVQWIDATSDGTQDTAYVTGTFLATNASFSYILTTQSGSSFNGGSDGCASTGNVSEPGQTTGPSSYAYASGLTTDERLNVTLPSTTWGYEFLVLYNSTLAPSTTVTWTTSLEECWSSCAPPPG